MAVLVTTIKKYIGTSADTKNTDCPAGSTFLEKDTGDLYIIDKEGSWSLKSEANKTLRIETIKRHNDLLAELKKANEKLVLIIEALDG